MKSNDIYSRVTGMVIEELEKGNIIWQQEWGSYGFAKNIANNHRYHGWNLFFLSFICRDRNYRSPYFITFRQAVAMGGSIRKGEKGYPVIWWAVLNETNSEESADTKKKAAYRVPRFHTVFNIDQAEGIDIPSIEKLYREETEPVILCEKIIAGMPLPPAIIHSGDKAYYNRATDTVRVPAPELFHSQNACYHTLFHELAHSTGHAKRLNRKELVDSDGFGNALYSKEELTAELAASFLSATAGITAATITNSAAYIQEWLKVLKADKSLILKAASQAEAAAAYILNENKVNPVIATEEQLVNT